MADDFDNVFDPSVKKKKKKPKKIVDLDEAEEPNERAKVDEPSVNEDTNKENESVQETQEKDIDDDMNFDDFSSMKKKKKKKKKKGFEEGQGNVEETKQEAVENNDENGVKEDEMNDDEMNFSLPTKKKKKKRVPPKENEIGQDDEEKEGSHPDYADKEYTYEQLLTRVFATMMDKNPSYVAGEKRKFIMRPPQVFKIGTKKTSFANFGDICKILHRQPKHLLAYLLAELGTSGSIDSNNQLIIKGRFQQKQIESVLRRYIKEYVTCHTCRSPDTILQKKERLYFLQCETCSSSCSVASIKSGFQAITGRRAALKSKQQ